MEQVWQSANERDVVSQYTSQDCKLLASLMYSGTSVSFLASLEHVALPKQTINQFKLDQQSRQQALRAYCPNVLFEFVTQSCLYVLKVQYYRALWLFGKSCKFTECREPEKRRTNFRLLKETNRKGTPLSVPRAKVVKHPKHFQRVCVLCAYVPLCVFAYFNVHSTEVKLCTLEVRRK